MSPILVRPVREQLEHDRIIRQLQARFKRKFEAGINPGSEQNMPVGTPPQVLFPDLVLYSTERGRKLQVIVEVETGESVNHLEALAEWAHFSRSRVPFHLYVPSGMVDVARRLCEDNQIHVSEIWSFHTVGDQVRFTMVHRSKEAPPVQPRKAGPPREAPPAQAAAPVKAAAPAKAAGPANRPAPPARAPATRKTATAVKSAGAAKKAAAKKKPAVKKPAKKKR